MKLSHWALGVLMMTTTAGVAAAQTKPLCPPLEPAGTFSAAQNASTTAPPGSPLIGLPDPYRPDFDWVKLPKGRVYGGTSAIDIDKDGKSVWIFDRCGNTVDGCSLPQNQKMDPLMKFDEHGNLVKSWGAGQHPYPHGIYVDPNSGNIWLVDGNIPDTVNCLGKVGNTVREYTPDGKLLMTIGPGPINGKALSGLSDVVTSPVNGDIFVVDGHGKHANDRVLKFDKTGKFLMEWGSKGPGPAQFQIPHGIAMDHEGRLYIADRTNKALKVFDQNGKLLHVWMQFGPPAGVFIDKNDVLYVADETANMKSNPNMAPGIRVADLNGKLTANIPYGPGNTLEGVAVDAAGNVYGATTNQPRALRWIKINKK